MTDVKKGDWVRVTIEGEVDWVSDRIPGRFSIVRENSYELDIEGPDGDGVTVEKIEPPVEVFKPGDVVRLKNGPYTYLITDGGYVEMTPGADWAFIKGKHRKSSTSFTSRDYEKVNLG